MNRERTGETLKDLLVRKNQAHRRESSSQNGQQLKLQNVEEASRQDIKTSKDTKKKKLRKHTVYLSPEQSRKLRIYAAENDMRLSDVVQKLINEHL